jgi:metal-responsive CopG/Arc/MetJ family transcriptional regulator
VDVDEGKAVRVNVTFTEGLLRSMDDFAKRRGVTRSAFLAKAVRSEMRRGA